MRIIYDLILPQQIYHFVQTFSSEGFGSNEYGLHYEWLNPKILEKVQT